MTVGDSLRERLRAAGIHVADGERTAVRPELARIAGLLRQRGCRRLGLVPAAADVGVAAIALETARALAEVSGSPTGVVDARGTWLGRASPAVTADVPLFSITWLTGRLAVLALDALPAGWPILRALELCLREETRAMGHVVVDLTGLDHTGEHLDAMSSLEAVAVVARAGRTTSRQLARWMRDIPPEKNLGVLLVGR